MAEWKKYDETTFTDFGSVGETMPAEDAGAGFGGSFDATMPADGGLAGGSFGAATPFDKTVPEDFTGTDSGAAFGNDDPWNMKTVPELQSFTGIDGETVRPATGWLVCIDGKTKGTDYRIYEGYSYIGRDPGQNQVAIPDEYLSAAPTARILYEKDSRKFYLTEVSGARNPMYLNDQVFLSGNAELKPYDIIRMGHTRLLFVPLCTEKFAWEE